MEKIEVISASAIRKEINYKVQIIYKNKVYVFLVCVLSNEKLSNVIKFVTPYNDDDNYKELNPLENQVIHEAISSYFKKEL
jgi:hypothetical protein